MLLTNNAETGTNGTTVTAANSGFDVVNIGAGSSLTFDNSYSAGTGALSYKYAAGTTPSFDLEWTTSISAPVTTVWFRLYVKAAALPGTNVRLATIRGGAANRGQIIFLTTGAIRMADSAGTTLVTSTSTATAGSAFRIEGFITGSATVGQVELKVFLSPDSATPSDTQTSGATANTGGTVDQWWWGDHAGVAGAAYNLDGLAISDGGYIGPLTAAAVDPGPAMPQRPLPIPFLLGQDPTTIPFQLQGTRDATPAVVWVDPGPVQPPVQAPMFWSPELASTQLTGATDLPPAPLNGTGSITLSGSANDVGAGAATAALAFGGTANQSSSGTGSLTFGATGADAASVTSSTGSLTFAETATQSSTATGSLVFGETGANAAAAAATGSLTFGSTATQSSTAIGSLAFGASGSDTGAASATGSLAFVESATQSSTATGSIAFSATGTATLGVGASGAIAFAETATDIGGATTTAAIALAGTASSAAADSGTASLSFAGTVTGKAPDGGAGALVLGGAASPAVPDSSTGSLAFSATAPDAAAGIATGSMLFGGAVTGVAAGTAGGTVTFGSSLTALAVASAVGSLSFVALISGAAGGSASAHIDLTTIGTATRLSQCQIWSGSTWMLAQRSAWTGSSWAVT